MELRHYSHSQEESLVLSADGSVIITSEPDLVRPMPPLIDNGDEARPNSSIVNGNTTGDHLGMGNTLQDGIVPVMEPQIMGNHSHVLHNQPLQIQDQQLQFDHQLPQPYQLPREANGTTPYESLSPASLYVMTSEANTAHAAPPPGMFIHHYKSFLTTCFPY